MALPASTVPTSAVAPTAEATNDRERLRVITGGGGGAAARGGPILPGGNGVLGMVIFLVAEAMLFAGLISAFFILRASADLWPPPDQPRLPLGVTFANTLVLLASGATMVWASGSLQRRPAAAMRWLAVTLGLAVTFLIVQGVEWARLMGFGLRATRSLYGGMFYTLIGSHAAHVVAAVAALAVLALRCAAGRARRSEFAVIQLYWLFVVGLWPLLYVMVYLL